jgi:hypothetical protein
MKFQRNIKLSDEEWAPKEKKRKKEVYIYIWSIFHMNRERKQQNYIIMYESPENVSKGENGNDIHFNSLMMSSVFP